ncbi:RagB/SusD family nutrient uptake outer membrane protein [Sphingobacterium oryzagri]|uniref:RagB/SusD family nutrient uptake outer membrane protein n=1 Tax=Sphingobacterium oryzagri TaxID=3025669 RepID=A0ABY7WL47_9SPHI|nr:RagB/SusD family nutrient uptake outer membrane protein [Sphingobacterium sp. KACC 22765]WDF70309.1 RagB/SusD family nutrient uptake outer membrane protein [Sphingobacterium sp. KACC 22765]
MKFTKNYIFFLLLAATSFTSCESLLEIDAPLNERPSVVVFRSSDAAKMALSGAYSQMSSNNTFAFTLTSFNGMAAGEVRYTSAAQFTDVQTNVYDPVTTTALSSIWADVYASIYRWNSILAGVQDNSFLPAALVQQMRGEALTMRAYCYFHLVNMFGDVPLVLITDASVTSLLPRTASASIYTQIIADLEEAKGLLAEDYATVNRMQVNRAAATALLARVYLHVADYNQALTNADAVLAQTARYTLVPSAQLGNVFLRNSSEAILQLGPALNATNGYTTEGSTFIPQSATSVPNYSLTTAQIAAFEAGDLRRSTWIRDRNVGGADYYLAYKYQNSNQTTATASGRVEVPMVLRLAEQYLIRAEARLETGNATGARADINAIRRRAGLADLASGADLNTALLKERQTELFCEQGARWYTIKRKGLANAVMGALRPATWQSFAQLYPIPQGARDTNPNLSQNDGYR